MKVTQLELDNLVRIGQLKPQPPAASEISGLLRSGGKRLADAERAAREVERRVGNAIGGRTDRVTP